MLTRGLWLIAGLMLIMTALLGNLGAVIGSLISPVDMVLGTRELTGIINPASGNQPATVNCDALCAGIVDVVDHEACILACQAAKLTLGQ